MRCLAKHTGGRILSDSVSEQFCEADKKPIDSTSCNLNCSLGEWRVVGSIQEVSGEQSTAADLVVTSFCSNVSIAVEPHYSGERERERASLAAKD